MLIPVLWHSIPRLLAFCKCPVQNKGCAESIAVNSHEFLAMNGKCWCCTCPTHAHQVHGHCVEAPCQVWLLDSDPNERPEDAGGEFCECG